jgi:hypothetical protein
MQAIARIATSGIHTYSGHHNVGDEAGLLNVSTSFRIYHRQKHRAWARLNPLYTHHYKWQRRMQVKTWLPIPILSSSFTVRVKIIRNVLLSVTRELITESNDWRFTQNFECSTSRTALNFIYLQLRSEYRPNCGTNCIMRQLQIILYIVGQIISRSCVTLQQNFKYMTICWRVTHMVYFSSVNGNRAL